MYGTVKFYELKKKFQKEVVCQTCKFENVVETYGAAVYLSEGLTRQSPFLKQIFTG